MIYIIISNDIHYNIKVNSYLLSITAFDKINNKTWKKTIYNYSPIGEIGVDSKTIINICNKTSNINDVIMFPKIHNNEKMYIIVKSYNLFLDFKK